MSRRRGACPALFTPMQTGDGLLARMLPAEGITPTAFAAFCAAAPRHGNGTIEASSLETCRLHLGHFCRELGEGLPLAELNLSALIPAGEAHARAFPENGRNRRIEAASVAFDGESQGPVRAGDFLDRDIFPGGILFAVDRDNAVVILNAGLGGG